MMVKKFLRPGMVLEATTPDLVIPLFRGLFKPARSIFEERLVEPSLAERTAVLMAN